MNNHKIHEKGTIKTRWERLWSCNRVTNSYADEVRGEEGGGWHRQTVTARSHQPVHATKFHNIFTPTMLRLQQERRSSCPAIMTTRYCEQSGATTELKSRQKWKVACSAPPETLMAKVGLSIKRRRSGIGQNVFSHVSTSKLKKIKNR